MPRLKLAKSQANAKQHPEAERWLFENYSHSSSRHYPKIIGHTLKWVKEQMCMYSWDYTINHNENEDEKEQ